MHSRKNSRPLDIQIKITINKVLLVVVPHLFIIVILLLFLRHEGLTIVLLFVSMISIFTSLIYFVRLHLTLLSKKSIKSLRIDDKNNWLITQKEGVETRVVVSSTSFVNNLLMILNMTSSSQKQSSVLICADSVSKEEFRVLKVILNTQKLDKPVL